MGRAPRVDVGGQVYHVLNRANGRDRIFDDEGDYAAFERVLGLALKRTGTRLLAYCVMPNHWHLVIWTRHDGELSLFTSWLGLTHTQRWHAHRKTAGTGHVYQARFKSFLVQDDDRIAVVCRYVERNALRANLVERAEDRIWGSLHHWLQGNDGDPDGLQLSDWPVPRREDWLEHVNAPQTEAEVAALRRSVRRGSPFGDDSWRDSMVTLFGLESTVRPQGRPRKGRLST